MNPIKKSAARGLILSLILAGIWTGGVWAQTVITPEPVAPLSEAGAVAAPAPPPEPSQAPPAPSEVPPAAPTEIQPAASASDLPPLAEPVPPPAPSEAPSQTPPAIPDQTQPIEPSQIPPAAPTEVQPAEPAPSLPPLAEPGTPSAPVTPSPVAPGGNLNPAPTPAQPVEAPAPAALTPSSPMPGAGGVVLGSVTHATPAQHKIAAGEDLHLLAAYYYGNARLWRLIYEANRKIISNPNMLTKGITIVIPAPPV